MKKLLFIWALMHFFACSKSSSSSNSNSEGGTITMKTASGVSYSSSNITRVLQTTTGVFYFNGRPFDDYNPNYFFSGNFDVNNRLTLQIPLKGMIGNTITTEGSSSEVTINNKDYYSVKAVYNLTSNKYPGKIAGTYSFYSGAALICSGTFDYNAK